MLSVNKKYVKYRPQVPILGRKNVQKWWQYAFEATGESSWRLLQRKRVIAYW